MTTGTVLFTIAHFALFIYTRVKYIRKYKAASKELAKVEIENMQLRSKIDTLETWLNQAE